MDAVVGVGIGVGEDIVLCLVFGGGVCEVGNLGIWGFWGRVFGKGGRRVVGCASVFYLEYVFYVWVVCR